MANDDPLGMPYPSVIVQSILLCLQPHASFSDCLYIDHAGVVYVPELDGLITLLNLDGQVLTRWLSPTSTGVGDGGHAVWVDSHGDLYLNQNQEGRRLLKYRRCS